MADAASIVAQFLGPAPHDHDPKWSAFSVHFEASRTPCVARAYNGTHVFLWTVGCGDGALYYLAAVRATGPAGTSSMEKVVRLAATALALSGRGPGPARAAGSATARTVWRGHSRPVKDSDPDPVETMLAFCGP